MSREYIADPEKSLHLIPPQASDYAAQVDHLYYGLLGVSSLLILVLAGLVLFFGWRYRKGSDRPRGGPVSRKATHRVEILFALGLGATFMALFGWAGHLYVDLYGGGGESTTINVVAKQWMWKVQHPDGTREINALHVPVDESIRLRLISQDVIHSFFVPALRIKRDAVPGLYNQVRFTATRVGEYSLFCAEYCGVDHSRMRGKVTVMSQSDYQDWLEGGGEARAPEQNGRKLFHENGCDSCHTGGPDARAPHLAGLFGRQVKLRGGGTLTADAAYIRTSIMKPQRQVVAGFRPIMPSFSGQLSEDDVLQLIAYIKSLKPASGQEEGERQ